MIGNVIQSLYLIQRDYPAAAALSFVLMAVILIVVVLHPLRRHRGAHGRGGESVTERSEASRAAVRRLSEAGVKWLTDHALKIYAALAVVYMLLPIARDRRLLVQRSGRAVTTSPG